MIERCDPSVVERAEHYVRGSAAFRAESLWLSGDNPWF
jgi:hypothetical protein